MQIGSRVQVRYRDGLDDEFAIVAAREADPRAGRVSAESPLGRALLGHGAGESVLFLGPRHVMSVTVVGVR